MTKIELTKEEKELLKQYQNLSASMPSLTNRLAIEIVPPIVFVGIWLYTESTVYLIALVAIMVTYNTQRVLRQYKNIAKLNSISKKTIGEATHETET